MKPPVFQKKLVREKKILIRAVENTQFEAAFFKTSAMNTTVLAFLLFASFFVAILWPDKETIMRFFSIIGRALSELAAKIRFEILIYRANRNIKRKNK